MSRIEKAISNIHYIDAKAAEQTWLNKIHPLAKLLISVLYIVMVLSFNSYNFLGLLGMSFYPVFLMISSEISLKTALNQLKYLLMLLFLIGIANPFLDRQVIIQIASVKISGGVISMLTLLMKGVFCLLAGYILILSTPMEKVVLALRILRIPKIIITTILLTYRYIIVLLKEIQKLYNAYILRAPKQKGIHYKAWGSFLGQLLLKSIHRSELVYESMILRGFNLDLYQYKSYKSDINSMAYFIVLSAVIMVFRFVPVLKLAGEIFN